jgi:hypothetical protein
VMEGKLEEAGMRGKEEERGGGEGSRPAWGMGMGAHCSFSVPRHLF